MTLSRILQLLSIGGIALTASGCLSKESNGLGQAGDMVYGLAKGIFSSDDETKPEVPAKVPRKMVADLPYASIGVTIDDNPEFLFLLANHNSNNDQLYTFGYQVSVVTRGGRLIRTHGLKKDVLGGRWEGEDIVKTAARTDQPVTGKRWMDTEQRTIHTYPVDCTAHPVGDEVVEIIGSRIPTRHVQEDCKVNDLKWTYTNDFWVIPETGFIWKSIQNVDPKTNPLAIETLRPST